MGYFDFKLQRINLCKIILQTLIKFDIKKKAKIILPCKFSNMSVVSGHTDRGWDKSYMYCGNSHSLFILKGQHSLPAYHCCSCCRACYGIRLTRNDFLPKHSGTEHNPIHTQSEETITDGADDKKACRMAKPGSMWIGSSRMEGG